MQAYLRKMINSTFSETSTTCTKKINTVKLIFRGMNRSLSFIMEGDVRLTEIARVFSSAVGLPMDQIKFSFKGSSLCLDTTPQLSELHDLDVIDVSYESLAPVSQDLILALDYKLNQARKRSKLAVFIYSLKSEWIVVLGIDGSETVEDITTKYRNITGDSSEAIRKIGKDVLSEGNLACYKSKVQDLGIYNGILIEFGKEAGKDQFNEIMDVDVANSVPSNSDVDQQTEVNGTLNKELNDDQDKIQSPSISQHRSESDALHTDIIIDDLKVKEISTEVNGSKSPSVIEGTPIDESLGQELATEVIENSNEEQDADGDILMEGTAGHDLLAAQNYSHSGSFRQATEKVSDSTIPSSEQRLLESTSHSKDSSKEIAQSPQIKETLKFQQCKPSDTSEVDETTELPPGNQQTATEHLDAPSALLSQGSPDTYLPSSITNNGSTQIPVIDVDDPICYKFHFSGSKDLDISIYEDQTFESFFKQFKAISTDNQKDLSFRFMNRLVNPKDTPLMIGALPDTTNTIEVIRTEAEEVTFVLQDKERKYSNVYFKAKVKRKFKKAFGVYATKNGLRPEKLEFKINGRKVRKSDTPEALGIENGSIVEIDILP